GTDHAARAGSAGFADGTGRTVHRDGRPLRAELFSVRGRFLSVFGARISLDPVLPGRAATYGQPAAGSTERSGPTAEELRRDREAIPAFASEARSARSDGGTGAAAEQREPGKERTGASSRIAEDGTGRGGDKQAAQRAGGPRGRGRQHGDGESRREWAA